MCSHAAAAVEHRQQEVREAVRETGDIKSKKTEEGYGEIWVRHSKTGKAQCKSECVNMYRPNLIIPRPPGPVIRCLIKAGDERREVRDRDGGRREG